MIGSRGLLALCYWLVVVLVAPEWPKSRSGEFYLRRVPPRAAWWGLDPFPSYCSVADAALRGWRDICLGFPVNGNLSCFDWICGNIAGVAAYLDNIAHWQIAALAVCPSLGGLTMFQKDLSTMSRLGTLVMGLFVSVTLSATTALLVDFNETAARMANVLPPSTFGWTASPGLTYGFAGCVLGITAFSALPVLRTS